MKIQRGSLLTEGKTKRVFLTEGQDNMVICEYKDTITAHNDPSLTREFEGKGADSNTVNCRVFKLLNQVGIPTAFVEQLSPNEFLALKCRMVPLEVVARRYLVGSYLKRCPDIAKGTRCPYLLIEFFLKTTAGKLVTEDSRVLLSGLTPEQDDPLIANPFDPNWQLIHPKLPTWHEDSELGNIMASTVIVMSSMIVPKAMQKMENTIRQVFLTIENAWNTLGLRLVDLKIEFGITPDGRLIVADVIDLDSWRLWRPTKEGEWEDVSKQSFRDGDELETVRAKYALVAKLAQQLDV